MFLFIFFPLNLSLKWESFSLLNHKQYSDCICAQFVYRLYSTNFKRNLVKCKKKTAFVGARETKGESQSRKGGVGVNVSVVKVLMLSQKLVEMVNMMTVT